MKLLVTGHNGYIGSVMVPLLLSRGHQVVGLDSYLFEDCTLGDDGEEQIPSLRLDLRDVEAPDLEDFDAILNLAALSNDPLGDLNPSCTYDINHLATVRLARLARAAGVPLFIHSSSCSLYGVAGQDMVTEEAPFNPLTPYGESKVRVEREVGALADRDFSPVFLRNATAYGVSPRLRADLVVNNLVGYAFTTGQIVIKSDGTPWRPLVHIEDISRAFLEVLEAPREAVHNQAFNVGSSDENYRVSELADLVQQAVPGSKVTYAEGAGPDPRSYRVDCSKIRKVLPGFQPRWTVPEGIQELLEAYRENNLTLDEFLSSRYLRIKHVRELLAAGRIGEDLRWRGER